MSLNDIKVKIKEYNFETNKLAQCYLLCIIIHKITNFQSTIFKVRFDFFWFILKVANIRCSILIKCSEQEARFKKYAIMS
jgi:hypothetical protein